MQYTETQIVISPLNAENKEIIMALLADAGYDSFTDYSLGLLAYIPTQHFHENLPGEVLETVASIFEKLEITNSQVAEVNWNAEWEKGFDPIVINPKCRIRAPFHPSDSQFEYEIIIEPKMSFGTGHHATTALMAQLAFDLDMKNKSVLDMGCGTGVLGILSSMLGALHVVGIDVDEWAYENTIENASRNQVMNMTAMHGGVECIGNQKFDVILANINRNILLEQLPFYAQAIQNQGYICLSGFYQTDMPVIVQKADQLHLTFQRFIEKDNWVAIQLIKQNI